MRDSLSETFYQHSDLFSIFGTGQGNGESAPTWLFTSIFLTKVLEWSEEEDLPVAPVGMAFYEIMTEWDPELHFLYESDWNHASDAGSFLAAAVFYSTIFVEASTNVSYRWNIDADLAEDLRDVASRTVLDDLESWRIDW